MHFQDPRVFIMFTISPIAFSLHRIIHISILPEAYNVRNTQHLLQGSLYITNPNNTARSFGQIFPATFERLECEVPSQIKCVPFQSWNLRAHPNANLPQEIAGLIRG